MNFLTETCVKVAYATEKEAVVALNRTRKSGGPKVTRSYLCPWCSLWHLTSRKNWQLDKLGGS